MGGWRKSTYSDGNGGSCVEIASGDGVMVRDTTDRDGVTLEFPTGSWAAFLMRLRPEPMPETLMKKPFRDLRG